VFRGHYEAAIPIILSALERSDAALVDAGRSQESRIHAISGVADLYGLLCLCYLRQKPRNVSSALQIAERGRARLLADALAFDETRIQDLDAPVQQEIRAAQEKRDQLRNRLGFALVSRGGGEMGASAEAVLWRVPTLEEHTALEAELRQATDPYLALCRRHGLITALEPLTYEEILAAAPEGGALVLPVVTETAAFAFVVAAGASKATFMNLTKLDRRALLGGRVRAPPRNGPRSYVRRQARPWRRMRADPGGLTESRARTLRSPELRAH
jgi:hypothetical protein